MFVHGFSFYINVCPLLILRKREDVCDVKINEDGNKKCAAPISAGEFLITVAFWRITAAIFLRFSLTDITFFHTRETFKRILRKIKNRTISPGNAK